VQEGKLPFRTKVGYGMADLGGSLFFTVTAFDVEDLQDYLTLLVQVANDSVEIRDEVERFDKRFQFKFEGYEVVTWRCSSSCW